MGTSQGPGFGRGLFFCVRRDFHASVFAAFMPSTQSLAFYLVLIALVFTIEASWYAIVALALSSERPRLAYLRYKTWVDRIAGGVMVALGLKLASSAYSA